MAKTADRWMVGLYWVPFVLGLATACAYLSYLIARWDSVSRDPKLLIILGLGIVVGAVAVAMALSAAADVQALAEARRREKDLERRLAEAHSQSRELNSHLEVLTAMREVTRILSDAVDLKLIAKNVFDVLEPLLGSEEIALILRDDDGTLAVKALRRDDKTLYADELSEGEVDLSDATQALEQQTLIKSIQAETGVFCVPLIADQNPVGVMRFEIPLEGSSAEKERRLDELEATLTDIAKHLALVVKTPSLHDRAIIDSLTGLFTRRHFDIRIDDMFRLARRYATPFSLILLDIDHFKQVNDKHGHRAGDAALREVAAVVTRAIRDCDSAFRYGGEEFAILLPETAAAQAMHIGERLRKAVKAHTIATDQGTITLTISEGVAEYGPDLASHGELIALADGALYEAKHRGRDSVNVAGGPPPGTRELA